MYITNDKPNVSGLVLSGSADFKTELSQSDMFDPRLQAVVLGVVDVSYGEWYVVCCILFGKGWREGRACSLAWRWGGGRLLRRVMCGVLFGGWEAGVGWGVRGRGGRCLQAVGAGGGGRLT